MTPIQARVMNLLANALAVLALAGMAVAAVQWLIARPAFTITRIEIAPADGGPLQYVTPGSLQAELAGQVRGNFFLLDLDAVRQRIEATPWVRHATVRRVWPSTLRVRLEEQRPLALWNENEMINTWGEAFTANRGELADDQQLPQLNGPNSSERLVVQRYAELARWFAPLGLRVREATLTPRYAWDVTLSSGLALTLGRDPAADATDPHGRPGAQSFSSRIQRFVQALPQLDQRLGGRAIAHADLRYPNGFAIALDPQPSTASARPAP